MWFAVWLKIKWSMKRVCVYIIRNREHQWIHLEKKNGQYQRHFNWNERDDTTHTHKTSEPNKQTKTNIYMVYGFCILFNFIFVLTRFATVNFYGIINFIYFYLHIWRWWSAGWWVGWLVVSPESISIARESSEHVCCILILICYWKRSEHWRPQYNTWWTVHHQNKCYFLLCFSQIYT